ncbi:MAG: alpha/beta hydrolase [Cyanobacteria bacterium REEB65]|nr:alpha/beta hydrolase [Cyanobacteria bacterium REEB65]
MLKTILATGLGALLLVGCGSGAPTGLDSTYASAPSENLFAGLGVSGGSGLTLQSSDLFSPQEFTAADTNHDGMLSQSEISTYLATQNDPAVTSGLLPVDPSDLAATGVSLGVLGGYYTLAGLKLAGGFIHPSRPLPAPSGNTFPSDGINLSYAYYRAARPTTSAVILCPDLGSDKEAMASYTAFLQAQYNVLAFDFRDQGASGGNETTGGLLEARDVAAAVAFLQSQQNSRIAVLGRGMGAVAALDAAASTPGISAVVADSAYATLSDRLAAIAKEHHYPLAAGVGKAAVVVAGLEVRAKLAAADAIANVPRIQCPVLFVQGQADATLPQSTAQSLYDATRTSSKDLWLVTGAGANGAIQNDAAEYGSRVMAFLQPSLSLAGTAPAR